MHALVKHASLLYNQLASATISLGLSYQSLYEWICMYVDVFVLNWLWIWQPTSQPQPFSNLAVGLTPFISLFTRSSQVCASLHGVRLCGAPGRRLGNCNSFARRPPLCLLRCRICSSSWVPRRWSPLASRDSSCSPKEHHKQYDVKLNSSIERLFLLTVMTSWWALATVLSPFFCINWSDMSYPKV